MWYCDNRGCPICHECWSIFGQYPDINRYPDHGYTMGWYVFIGEHGPTR